MTDIFSISPVHRKDTTVGVIPVSGIWMEERSHALDVSDFDKRYAR